MTSDRPRKNLEWEQLLDRVIEHAEDILGEEVRRKDEDRETLKMQIVTWLAIEQALADDANS